MQRVVVTGTFPEVPHVMMHRLLPLFLAMLVALSGVAPAHADDGPGEPPPGVTMKAWVEGEAKLGHTLWVQWDIEGGSGAGIYYRWFCDGEQTRETSQSFSLYDTSCLGKVVSAEITLYDSADNWIIVRRLPTVGPVVTGPVSVHALIIGNSGSHRTETPVWVYVSTTPRDAEVSYQWLLDGKAIAGAVSRSFTPSRQMLGRRLSVTVSASAEIWQRGSQTAEPTEPLAPGWLADGARITGAVEVGGEVWAEPTGIGHLESLTYAWSLDGVTVPGATNPYLALTTEMAGRQLRAIVTAGGYGRTEEITSAPSMIRNGKLTTQTPTLVGSATVGWILEARAPRWAVTPTRVTHQWYRTVPGGSPEKIVGATTSRVRLAPSDQGRTFFVVMTATAPGRESVTLQSNVSAPVVFSVYTTPGEHMLNGRRWRTSCEPYSQTQRCRTEIWATQISAVGGRFVESTGWVFNNLTYLASPRSLWDGNALASNRFFESGGRRWKSDCDTAETGRNACRVYIETTAFQRSGSWYSTKVDYVFNNVIHFG